MYMFTVTLIQLTIQTTKVRTPIWRPTHDIVIGVLGDLNILIFHRLVCCFPEKLVLASFDSKRSKPMFLALPVDNFNSESVLSRGFYIRAQRWPQQELSQEQGCRR